MITTKQMLEYASHVWKWTRVEKASDGNAFDRLRNKGLTSFEIGQIFQLVKRYDAQWTAAYSHRQKFN